jgi:hypothetical protein
MSARIVRQTTVAAIRAADAWLRSRGLFDRGLNLVDEVVGVVRLDHPRDHTARVDHVA